LKEIPSGTVLISERLLLLDIVHLNTSNIAAIVTEIGSPVSHTAILCRGLNILYVARIKGAATIIRSNYRILVNSDEGSVIVHPNENTCLVALQEKSFVKKVHVSKRDCRKVDDIRIEILANAYQFD